MLQVASYRVRSPPPRDSSRRFHSRPAAAAAGSGGRAPPALSDEAGRGGWTDPSVVGRNASTPLAHSGRCSGTETVAPFAGQSFGCVRGGHDRARK